MIPEVGHFALIVALCVALVQGVLPMWGAARGSAPMISVARPAAQCLFMFTLIAFASLAHAFLADDFSVRYVASHSNASLPAFYRFAAVWGGHEGSLLLWTTLLSAWGLAVTLASRSLPDVLVARVLAVMGLVSVGFLAFMLFASNPFERLAPVPADGRDLNPLLQDPGMVLHPPLLYMGYVGFSVAFAFAIAALVGGRLDAAWARWSRPWTTAAWGLLTLGIGLGSFWAYYELGWGGWWFWDPVENASFMPWLVGTALVHSLAVTEKRGAFKAWTVLLAIFAFALSLLGTFLVRSGVLTSVHAFATDPRRGIFVLAFLAITVGASLLLFALRAPALVRGARFEPVSREATLMLNNAFFCVAAFSVLLGTLYPLVLDALDAGKLSVGPPYFEAVFVPIVVPALLLLGVGPNLRWRGASASGELLRLRWAAFCAIAIGAAVPWALGRWGVAAAGGVALGAWIVAGVAVDLRGRTRGRRFAAWASVLPRGWVGMALAHAGVAVFVLGVTISRNYGTDVDLKMRPGDVGELAGHAFRLVSTEEVRGPNYTAARVRFEVSVGERTVAVLEPEKRVYRSQRTPMTEAAIDAGFARHLYVALGEPLESGAWTVRLYHKPLIGWIWGGCVLMGLGALVAVSDRRYRSAQRLGARLSAGAPTPGPAP